MSADVSVRLKIEACPVLTFILTDLWVSISCYMDDDHRIILLKVLLGLIAIAVFQTRQIQN